jgi:uncharacterized protein
VPDRSTSRSDGPVRRERRPRRPLVVRKSLIHGVGAFATRAIRAGERIDEYTGERLSSAEARTRYDHTVDPHPATYLFSIDDETMIDGLVGGNDTRFINHSCEPNCRAVCEAGRMYIHAARDIPIGCELLLDYNLRFSGTMTNEARERMACACGAPSCRGTMLGTTRPTGDAGAGKA